MENESMKMISNMKIGIIGLGGTGSFISEQLVRIGISDLVLVDMDTFEPSNWSRMYGSSWENINNRDYKGNIIYSYLKKINPKLKIKIINDNIMKDKILKKLMTCNLIFSCLDRHAPRAILNELSYQTLIPILDVGTGLKRIDNKISGSARSTLIGPENGCYFCHNIINSDMIYIENLDNDEYLKLKEEGYIGSYEKKVPSIITYTSLAGNFGIHMFLKYLNFINNLFYNMIIYDIYEDELYKINNINNNDCVCIKKLGKGITIPFSTIR
jgi:molybdopterin/thiamine biosynthesis adenylyltransferase